MSNENTNHSRHIADDLVNKLVNEQPDQKTNLLEKLIIQRSQFIAQKEQTQVNLNQLLGAIFACDEMIKKCEEMKGDEVVLMNP